MQGGLIMMKDHAVKTYLDDLAVNSWYLFGVAYDQVIFLNIL